MLKDLRSEKVEVEAVLKWISCAHACHLLDFWNRHFSLIILSNVVIKGHPERFEGHDFVEVGTIVRVIVGFLGLACRYPKFHFVQFFLIIFF